MSLFRWRRRKPCRITAAGPPDGVAPAEAGAARPSPSPPTSVHRDGDGSAAAEAYTDGRGRPHAPPEKVIVLAALVAEQVGAAVATQVELLDQRLQAALERRVEGLLQSVRTAADEAAERRGAFEQRVLDACSTTAQRATQRPIIDGLVSLYHRICRESQFLSLWYGRDPELTGHLGCRQLQEHWDGAARSFAAEILQVLQPLGVEPIVGGGGQFDPHIQHVASVEQTSQPELHGQIARRLRAGFTWHGQVLRSEDVVVYKKERRNGARTV